MAQSSSVAREPSMEEILASIRRIIEESDTTRPDDTPPVPVNSDIPSRTAVREPHSADRYSDEEAELPPREGIAVAAATPSFESPLGRSSSPLQSKLVEREPAPDTPLNADIPDRQAADAPGQQVAPLPAETLEDASGVHTATKVPEMHPALTEEAALRQEDPAAADLNPPVFDTEAVELADTLSVPTRLTGPEPDARMDDEVSLDLEQALEPILSEAAERQVSSAFDDLSFAVRNEQRRSFDEIAQEIMRPLLQDWLDNNLPTLVERLVREEIERVARGGRR
ncbi:MULTISPECIES: PopZ family protein [Phyllobacterium]|nr:MULTISPECIES: DUF2497 domain-containing protein [Phyllobacterium]UXN64194.1 DUF2497 domain-containing protein [Phyllobacterium sp. A18/5-2]